MNNEAEDKIVLTLNELMPEGWRDYLTLIIEPYIEDCEIEKEDGTFENIDQRESFCLIPTPKFYGRD